MNGANTMNTERTDYEIMLARTKAAERGAVPIAIERSVETLWTAGYAKCGCGGLCDSGHPCPMAYAA